MWVRRGPWSVVALVALPLCSMVGVFGAGGAGVAHAAAPEPPTAIAARAGDGTAVVRWVAPVETGGVLVTAYTVTASPGGATCTTSGSPAATSCTVTGLTNGTAYQFTVAATTSGGTSIASTPSSSVTPLAGTTGVNFVAEPATRVLWSSGTVAATSPPGGRAWPLYVYANSYYPTPGVYVTAADVNSQAGVVNCWNTAWVFSHILCDPPTSSGAQTADDPDFVYKPATHAGFTVDSLATTEAFVVIDLRSVTAFTTLRVFQMFSDGKTTQASIAIHAESSDTTPVYNDAGWTELDRRGVGTGLQSMLGSNLVTSCPTVLDVGAHASRYVRLSFKNSGEFGDPSWVEVGAVKLFFETEVPVLGDGCPPEPPSDAVAVGGNASATVSWTPGSTNVTSWELQVRPVGGSWTTATTDPASVAGDATSAVVVGLTNGTAYEFRVLATNAVASSPYSLPSNAVTPSNLLPATPTNVVADPGEASATVTWDFVPGATGYVVQGSPSGSCTTTTATTCVITGLTPGLDYTFTVTAVNDNGSSGASVESLSVVPLAPPTTSSTAAPTTSVPASSTTAPGASTTVAPTTTAAGSGGSLPITGRSGATAVWALLALVLGAACWAVGRRISLVDEPRSDQTR